MDLLSAQVVIGELDLGEQRRAPSYAAQWAKAFAPYVPAAAKVRKPRTAAGDRHGWAKAFAPFVPPEAKIETEIPA